MSTASSRTDEAFFEDVANAVTEGIVSFDGDGAIGFVNSAAAELLGYTPDTLLERSVVDLLADGETAVLAGLQRRAMGEDRPTAEVELQDARGRSVPVTLAVEYVERDDRNLFIATATERDSQPERLEALNEASRRLLHAETPAKIGQITVHVVETVLPRSVAAVWHVEADELQVVDASTAATDAASRSEPVPPEPITAGTAEMGIFEDGKPVLLEAYDAVSEPAHPDAGLTERFVVPLGTHGVLTVDSSRGGLIDDSARELVEILAQNARAAFDRLEHERLVRQRSAAIEAAVDGMAITDERGVVTHMNDVHAELFGYDDASEFVGTTWKRLFAADEVERFESDVLPVVYERGLWRGHATGVRADGTEVPVDMTLAALADGGVVCIVRDGAERTAQERQLRLLNDVSRDLMKADDSADVSRITINAVEGVLGFDCGCLRRFDPETNRLEYAALTNAAERVLEERAPYDLESTLAGHAFRGERTVVIDRSTAATAGTAGTAATATTAAPPGIARSSLHVPIGSYGVLTILPESDEEIDERDVQLAEMLARTARTAIARAERVRLLRTHERDMRHQRNHLETHTRLNTLVQEIGRQLIEATTRAELEETICERLANADPYHSAWIGDVETRTDRLTTRVGYGIADEDLEAIDELPISSVGHGTVERMLESGSIEVVRFYERPGCWSTSDADESPDVRSTAAIPLAYGEHIYGVLVVTGVGDGLFGEETLSGFELLGRVTGFAITAIRNRTLLLSDSVVELEFVVSDADSQVFCLAVSAALECECRFERSVPTEGGTILSYHTITGSDPSSVLEVAANAAQIDDARVIREEDDHLLLQTLASTSTAQIALQAGATLRSVVAVDGEARVVLEAPQTANVRDIAGLFEERFSSVELVGKRDRDRSITTAAAFRRSVDEMLTEKQRAALESAYAAGYYDWPRAITAEELAASMNISSSTLHQHLRKGIWRLLRAFLEADQQSAE